MDTHTPHRPVKPFLGTFADYDVVPYDITDDSTTQAEKFIDAYDAAATDEERAALVAAIHDVYDELLLQEDDTLRDIFHWIEETGHQDDTLVILTADHGETLADDGTPIIG